MNMKRTIALVLTIAICATMALGGTLAFLTDTEEEVNIMTVGRVDIELIEQQRNEDGSELENFEDGKQLLPMPGSAQGEKDRWGMTKAENYVDKIVNVENKGNTPAYVRVIVGVPAALEESTTASAGNALHWNVGNRFTAEGNYAGEANPGYDDITMNVEGTATVDGIVYNVYSFTYNTALAPHTSTPAAAFVGFYLDSKVDWNDEDGKYYLGEKVAENLIDYDLSQGVRIPVVAQAVQADGFADAAEAFTASGLPVIPWNANTSFATVVYTADELNEILAQGGVAMLAGDMEAENFTVEEGVSSDINLAQNTLDGNVVAYGNVKITNGSMNNDDTALEVKGGNVAVAGVDITAGTDGTGAFGYAAIAENGSEVEFTNVSVDSANGGVGVADGSKVTFNSGSVAVNSKNTSGRYNFYVVGEGTKLTINGGNFSFNKSYNQKRAYIYCGAGATVYVTGGTFGPASTRSGYTAGILGDGTVIITGGTFGFDPSNWVADGYQAVQSGSTWTVSAK